MAQCILLLLKSTRDPLIRFEATGGGNLSAKSQTNASTSSIENGTRVTQSLNPMDCFQMTKYNQFLVKYIVGFLCYLLTRRKQNKLNVKILAEVFAEALIHSTDVESKKYVSKLILDHYRSDKGRKDGGAWFQNPDGFFSWFHWTILKQDLANSWEKNKADVIINYLNRIFTFSILHNGNGNAINEKDESIIMKKKNEKHDFISF